LFDGRRHFDRYRLDQELTAWILERAKEGRRNFVAAGGDGTVHFVLNCLMNLRSLYPQIRECRLGAIALGATNGFHRPFLSTRCETETEIYYRLNFDSAFLHDVGKVQTPATYYFIINSNVGVTAQANLFLNQEGPPWFKSLKKISNDAASVFAAAREFYQFQSLPVRLTQGGSTSRSVELVNLGVAKNPHFAGSFCYDMPQKPNDGKLGIYICEGMGKIQLLKTLISLSQGKFFGLPNTDCFQTKDLRIDSCAPFALEIDGEIRKVRGAQFKVLPENVYLCP
jgi:diacylglycerol kinase family enzyme